MAFGEASFSFNFCRAAQGSSRWYAQWIGPEKWDDDTPHFYVTRDYGRTWSDVAAGLPQDQTARVIRDGGEVEIATEELAVG